MQRNPNWMNHSTRRTSNGEDKIENHCVVIHIPSDAFVSPGPAI